MEKAITVNELVRLCKAQIKKGNGNKKILISSDDEGNEYHELFYDFTDTEGFGFGDKYGPGAPADVIENIKDYIVLG